MYKIRKTSSLQTYGVIERDANKQIKETEGNLCPNVCPLVSDTQRGVNCYPATEEVVCILSSRIKKEIQRREFPGRKQCLWSMQNKQIVWGGIKNFIDLECWIVWLESLEFSLLRLLGITCLDPPMNITGGWICKPILISIPKPGVVIWTICQLES